MNIIPKTQPMSANYVCTWGTQNKLVRKFKLPNVAASGARDTLNEDYLFNHDYLPFFACKRKIWEMTSRILSLGTI